MKNTSSKGYAILGILFVLLSTIALVVPTEKSVTFWVAYIFTVIAFAAQIAIWKRGLGGDTTLKSKFLGLPIIHIGVVYFIVQIIAFTVFTAVPSLPTWSVIVTCSLILGISAVCMIATDTGRSEIERVEDRVQKKVFYIKELQVDVELLAERESDASTKASLKKLAEEIRFSDPMSAEQLADLEGRISAKVEELKTAQSKLPIINELDLLITERNKKCKILK